MQLPQDDEKRMQQIVYLQCHIFTITLLKVLQEGLQGEKPILLDVSDEPDKTIEVLEEPSHLRKHLRRYQPFRFEETWTSRWIVTPIAHLFPAERREEWLGDLYESNLILLDQNYPRWLVNVINVGRTVILIVSAMQIKLSDLLTIKLKSTN
jgi:hypothetical protein